MPKNSAKKAAKNKARGKSASGRSGQSSRTLKRPNHSGGGRKRRSSAQDSLDHKYIMQDDCATHVLVPVDEYEELVKASMVERAIASMEDDDNVEWIDADQLGLELAAEHIAAARKAKGLTQKQLGEKLGLPQSQISRIERNPDHTTVRTLKRIARALRVDVSALMSGH